jgi:glucosamine-6-phosphate deaminase
MKWELVDDYEALSRRSADFLLDAVRAHPRIVLGLPTGRTPLGMYEQVVRECSSDSSCFRDATTFNLDEYVGIGRDHPGSYFTYMKQHLIDRVHIDPRHAHVPDGTASAPLMAHPKLSFEEALEQECSRYEEAIRRAGGLGFCFLGLGRNGHIGFNEPGTPFDSRTRVVKLSESTRVANASLFAGGVVPERAITMGIGTILGSRRLVLLASGASKQESLRRFVDGGLNPAFPASALRLHSDVLVIADRLAAGELALPTQ